MKRENKLKGDIEMRERSERYCIAKLEVKRKIEKASV